MLPQTPTLLILAIPLLLATCLQERPTELRPDTGDGPGVDVDYQAMSLSFNTQILGRVRPAAAFWGTDRIELPDGGTVCACWDPAGLSIFIEEQGQLHSPAGTRSLEIWETVELNASWGQGSRVFVRHRRGYPCQDGKFVEKCT